MRLASASKYTNTIQYAACWHVQRKERRSRAAHNNVSLVIKSAAQLGVIERVTELVWNCSLATSLRRASISPLDPQVSACVLLARSCLILVSQSPVAATGRRRRMAGKRKYLGDRPEATFFVTRSLARRKARRRNGRRKKGKSGAGNYH